MSLHERDAVTILLSRARIVTEPKKLAYLNAKAEKNNAKRGGSHVGSTLPHLRSAGKA
jgi:hypothetical protein